MLEAAGAKFSKQTKDKMQACIDMHAAAIESCKAAMTDMTDNMTAAIAKHQQAVDDMQAMLGKASDPDDDGDGKSASRVDIGDIEIEFE